MLNLCVAGMTNDVTGVKMFGGEEVDIESMEAEADADVKASNDVPASVAEDTVSQVSVYCQFLISDCFYTVLLFA